MEYVQHVSVSIEPEKLGDAQALFDALEAHRSAARRHAGFAGYLVTRSVEQGGETLLTVESRWRDAAALADYASGGETAETIINDHASAVNMDTLRVRRMEAVGGAAADKSGIVYERFAIAAMVPLVIVGFGFAIIYTLSRIYLQIDENAAVALAGIIALGILLGAAVVAANPRMPSWALASGGLTVAAALLGTAAWAAVATDPARGEHAAGEETPTPAAEFFVGLQDNKFTVTDITIPPGQDVVLPLRNQGKAIHNMHVSVNGQYDQTICETGGPAPCSDPSQIRAGQEGTITLNLAAGTYNFRCDFHPTEMTGTITVREGAPVPGGGPGEPGEPGSEPGGPQGQTIDLQDNKFSATELTAPANTETVINLVNQGKAIHNMHVASSGDFEAAICQTNGDAPCSNPSQIRAGQQGTITLNLPAGEYKFRCDFHPTEMTGTLTVR
jgi:plastocyanin/quinol monooxygenase YgiN